MNRRIFCAHLTGAMAALTLGCNAPTKGVYLEVDPRLCVGCGECTTVCDGDAITLIHNKAFIDPTKCVQCGKCVKVCPYDAII